MSYDVDIQIKTGPDQYDTIGVDWNFTYNLYNMFAEANMYVSKWDNRSCEDVAIELERVIKLMEAEPSRFIAHNPPNGWGSYDGIMPVLHEMYQEFRKRPLCTVRVS